MSSSHFSAFDIDILYPKVKDQNSFYETLSLAICINIKAFNWINRKQLNVLKIFLEYVEFSIITEKDSALKVI